MTHRHLILLAAPALLLACSKEPAPGPAPSETATATSAATPAAAAAAPALAVDSEGLRLFDPATGSARPLPFGTQWKVVTDALAGRGTPRSGKMEECGAGPLDFVKWEDSLTLYGQEGAFMGWFADSQAAGKISTAAGVGPGSTRAELEGAYKVEVFESSLGTEFNAGDLFGLLDGTGKDAKITAMWAGVSCNFT